MHVKAKERDLDWMFESLAVAACCRDCPARLECVMTETKEQAAGIPERERSSCGEMLRRVITVETEENDSAGNKPAV